MSIVTQCPSCGTTFRVTPPQLQAQQGMVRCGRCAQVFNGFKTLATLADAAPPETALPEAAPPDVVPQELLRTVPMGVRTPVATPPAPVALSTAPAPPPAQTTVATVIASVPHSPSPAVAMEPRPVAVAAARVDDPPSFTPADLDLTEPRRPSGGWMFGVLLMAVSLAAQGAYFLRSDIAVSMPETRLHLNRMCELLNCTVALPQRPRQISIEASDMQVADTASPGLIALTATLRNNATTELGYPALDVVLTNTKEHTVARRIFMPGEYLAAGKDTRGGMAPNAEVTFRLDLDTGDLGAAGFRLALMPAPAR